MNQYRLATICILFAGLMSVAIPARGEDWMFRRSYYSHLAPGERPAPEDVPEIRSAYRRPYVQTQPGAAARRIYRFNRINIPNGNSFDSTIIYEGSFNERP